MCDINNYGVFDSKSHTLNEMSLKLNVAMKYISESPTDSPINF